MRASRRFAASKACHEGYRQSRHIRRLRTLSVGLYAFTRDPRCTPIPLPSSFLTSSMRCRLPPLTRSPCARFVTVLTNWFYTASCQAALLTA